MCDVSDQRARERAGGREGERETGKWRWRARKSEWGGVICTSRLTRLVMPSRAVNGSEFTELCEMLNVLSLVSFETSAVRVCIPQCERFRSSRRTSLQSRKDLGFGVEDIKGSEPRGEEAYTRSRRSSETRNDDKDTTAQIRVLRYNIGARNL